VTIQSFDAESSLEPKVLILGSIPGVASLNAQQYYAHPRNAFWPIMSSFFSFDGLAPYAQRLAALLTNQVALWDVLAAAEREGSLDSAIITSSQIVNPIDEFALAHTSLKAVLLNGGKAAASFKKAFQYSESLNDISIHLLPSTSPAYAAMKQETKMQQWHDVLNLYYC
jgi:hypoxanthine-DNA glycosylase